MKKYIKNKYIKHVITNKKSGYILILTLFMISMTTAILTSILQKTLNFQKQVNFDFSKQKARVLALSAIELALSQISFKQAVVQDTDNQESGSVYSGTNQGKADNHDDKNAQEKGNFEKEWFKNLSKVINKWQIINVKEGNLSATINLYITCQEGKLNLNYIQKKIEQKEKNKSNNNFKQTSNTANNQSAKDQEKDKVKDKDQNKEDGNKVENKEGVNKESKEQIDEDSKGFIGVINQLVSKKLKINLIDSIKELRNKILRDIDSPLDLLKLDKFSNLRQNIFYDMSSKENIYLTDLFSSDIYESKTNVIPIFSWMFGGSATDKSEINPWFLSKSLGKLLELNMDQINLQDLASKFKNNINWQKDWDEIFAPIYGKSFSSIDKDISNLFSKTFNPKSFSVVIHINLSRSSQRLFAILKKDDFNQDKNSKSAKFKISKIYWF